MNTNWTRGLSLVGLLLASSAATQANDIVDFLQAINGNSGRRNPPVVLQPVGGRGHAQVHQGHGHGPGFSRPGFERPPVDFQRRPYVNPPVRSGVQIDLRFAANGQRTGGYSRPIYVPAQSPVQVLPPVQAYPPVTSYPALPRPSFAVGQFVDCQVPLATCVRVEDECNIAPNAVPVVIAVRDPHFSGHDACERLVFVQIFVPPCPLRNLQISPCQSRINLDYGQFEVDIKSVNGMVVVDYDN